ncbi:hypothetical protein HAX54_001006 [Datura stramonium]|uniref:Uncharacterized protein n=1 Tax=Datura stramonium TaxID=4076 RepID=A0ABS8T1R8_DATST|nr:hypothetical protein [Datura stramonium]
MLAVASVIDILCADYLNVDYVPKKTRKKRRKGTRESVHDKGITDRMSTAAVRLAARVVGWVQDNVRIAAKKMRKCGGRPGAWHRAGMRAGLRDDSARQC